MNTRQGQFGRFQAARRGNGPTHEDLAKLYGALVFDTAVPLLPDLAAKDMQLESDSLPYINEMMGGEFAGKVAVLKGKIRDTVVEDHRGPFDGWVKFVAKKEFGPGSDFAQEYGDQELNLLCLVLSHQAGKVADMRCGEKILGREVPDTKTAWRAVGPELEKKVAEMRAEFDTAKAGGVAPWAGIEVEAFSVFLARKTAHDTLMRGGEGKFKYLNSVVNRLKEWATSGHKDDQLKSKKDVLVQQVAQAMDQITGMKERYEALKKDDKLSEALVVQNDYKQLETKVRELEAEIGKISVDEQKQPVKGDGGTTSLEPIGTIGDAAKVITDAVNSKPAKPMLTTLNEVNMMLDRKQDERKLKQKALDGHQGRIEEIGKLMEAAQASGDKKRYGQLMVGQADVEETVPRLEEEIEQINARITELEATKAELTKPTEAAPVVVAPASMTFPQFLKAVKASDLSDGDKWTLKIKGIGDLDGAFADFTVLTTPVEDVETLAVQTEFEQFVAEVEASGLDEDEKQALREEAQKGDAGIPYAREMFKALIA